MSVCMEREGQIKGVLTVQAIQTSTSGGNIFSRYFVTELHFANDAKKTPTIVFDVLKTKRKKKTLGEKAETALSRCSPSMCKWEML